MLQAAPTQDQAEQAHEGNRHAERQHRFEAQACLRHIKEPQVGGVVGAWVVIPPGLRVVGWWLEVFDQGIVAGLPLLGYRYALQHYPKVLITSTFLYA